MLMLVIIASLLLPAEAAAQFSGFPSAGFTDGQVIAAADLRLSPSDDPRPTSVAWLPNDELLTITQQGGLFRGEGDSVVRLLNLSSEICSFDVSNEMGLLGLAVDPGFGASSGNIFVYYTDSKPGGGCGNRVSRFSLNLSNNAIGNEVVLIDNIAAPNGNHNGGDLQFGLDGLLYISVGDGGKDLRTNAPGDQNGNARRLDLLNGKILRITPDGGIPAGNPFRGAGTGRCAGSGSLERQGGRVEAEGKNKKQKRRAKQRKRQKRKNRNRIPATVCQEIFATGLRNPYRIAFDPTDATGPQRFFINDVGGDGFEEINDGQAGVDYGWNLREGLCPIDGIGNNCSGSNQFVDPVFAYRTGGSTQPFAGCRTITGGAFAPGGDWPADYLFADLGCGGLFAMTVDGSDIDVHEFASGEGATHLAFGPDGDLYYTTFSNGGEVRKIVAP